MTKFQLIYLNLRAKAEPIRLLLTYVHQPFEDKRENFTEFTKKKDVMPLTKLPKLIVDNSFEICYTSVILNYLGRKFGIEPQSDQEKSICEYLAQRIQEYFVFIKPYVNCLLGLTPSERDYAPIFEKQLQTCNNGYLVGEKLTWIDFYAASFTDFAMTFGKENIFEKFPRLQYHCHSIHSLPQLQNYLKQRPKTLC